MKRYLFICSFIFSIFLFPFSIVYAQNSQSWKPASFGQFTYLSKVVKSTSKYSVDILCLIKPSKAAEDVGGVGRFEQYIATYQYKYPDTDNDGDYNDALIEKSLPKHLWWKDWEAKCGEVPWKELQYYFAKK